MRCGGPAGAPRAACCCWRSCSSANKVCPPRTPGVRRRARAGRRALTPPARGGALLAAVGYKGGYFKYGTLSWKQTKILDDGIMVKFTLRTAWDSAFFSRCAALPRARPPPGSWPASAGVRDAMRCAGARPTRRTGTA